MGIADALDEYLRRPAHDLVDAIVDMGYDSGKFQIWGEDGKWYVVHVRPMKGGKK